MTDSFDNSRNEAKGTGGDSSSAQFLTFTVNGDEYGVDIMSVREIKGWTETTRLPNSPECMRGVMNLRGLIIPIFDLRARFAKKLTEANSSNVVIIQVVNGRNIGVLVDGVSDILTINASDIKPAPELESNISTNFINGLISIEKRIVVLLNMEHVFVNMEIPEADIAAPEQMAMSHG